MTWLPCFERYRAKEFPYGLALAEAPYKDRLSKFLGNLVLCISPQELQKAIGQEIQIIRPKDSAESKRAISFFSVQDRPLYKIDYGKNAFRVYFILDGQLAYVLGIDTKHSFFSK